MTSKKKSKTPLDEEFTLEGVIPDGPTHTSTEEDDPQEPEAEEGYEVEPETEDEKEEMSLKTADAIMDEVGFASTSSYTEAQIEEGRAFLERFSIDTSSFSPQDVFEKLEKIQTAKEEAAQVLSRGRVLDGIDRLLTFVPVGFSGGFFSENDVDIRRAEALGWTLLLDDKANQESSTGKSDGLTRLGDQVLMIIPEEKYVGGLLAKAERYKRRRESRDPNKPQQGDETMGADPLFPILKL